MQLIDLCAFRSTSNDFLPIKFQFFWYKLTKVSRFGKGMAKILMVRASCCSNHYLTYAATLSPQKAMAICSSFSPLQFGAKPISSSPIKPHFCVQVKAFSSQQSNSPTKGTFSVRDLIVSFLIWLALVNLVWGFFSLCFVLMLCALLACYYIVQTSWA